MYCTKNNPFGGTCVCAYALRVYPRGASTHSVDPSMHAVLYARSFQILLITIVLHMCIIIAGARACNRRNYRLAGRISNRVFIFFSPNRYLRALTYLFVVVCSVETRPRVVLGAVYRRRLCNIIPMWRRPLSLVLPDKRKQTNALNYRVRAPCNKNARVRRPQRGGVYAYEL